MSAPIKNHATSFPNWISRARELSGTPLSAHAKAVGIDRPRGVSRDAFNFRLCLKFRLLLRGQRNFDRHQRSPRRSDLIIILRRRMRYAMPILSRAVTFADRRKNV